MISNVDVITKSPNRKLISYHQIYCQGNDAVILKYKNEYFFFDVTNSDSVMLSEDSYRRLVSVENRNFTPEQIIEIHELKHLMLRNDIFQSDSKRIKKRSSDKLRLQDVVVQIAYDCNLACTYCYADEGHYGGPAKTMMTAETAEKLIDFSFSNCGSSSIGFALLGGEPLLNKKVLKHFILYANEISKKTGIKAEYSITTNGIGLNKELRDFFQKYDVGIRLSLDGTKDIHDKYRLDRQGKGTYDKVNDKYAKKMKEDGIAFQVRSSFFGDYGDRLLDQAKTMIGDLGYDNIKMDFIWGNEATEGIVKEKNLDLTLNGIDHLSDWFNKIVLDEKFDWRKFNPYSKYMGRLFQKPVITNLFEEENAGNLIAGGSILENSGVECGAGINVISVSYNGDIYSCHRTEGMPKFKMGDIYSGVDENHIKWWSNNWRLTNEDSDCSKCWARFVCIGGCPAFGVYQHDDPLKNDRVRCKLRRQFIADSIILTHKIKQETVA